MRLKSLCSLALVVVVGWTQNLTAQSFATPEKLTESFVTAYNRGETEVLKGACAEVFWNSKIDSPQKLIKQGYAAKRNFFLELTNIAAAKNRVVVTLTVLKAENRRPVDEIYMYAELREKFWLFYGFNEDKKFKTHFLAGLLEGDFHPKKLPASSELESLGSRIAPLLARLTEETKPPEFAALFKDVFKVSASASNKIYPHVFKSVKNPTAFESLWSASLGRGALILGMPKTPENAYPDSFAIYFLKTPDGWELYGTGSSVSLSGFLDF